MLSKDKQYQTRDGDECIYLINLPRDEGFPWLATLKDCDNGRLYQEWYNDRGEWSNGNETARDLIEIDSDDSHTYAHAEMAA